MSREPRSIPMPFACPATGAIISQPPRRGLTAAHFIMGLLILVEFGVIVWLSWTIGAALEEGHKGKAAQTQAAQMVANTQAETNLKLAEAAETIGRCHEAKRLQRAGLIAFLRQEIERKKLADVEMNTIEAAKVMDTLAAARLQYCDDLEVANLFREAFSIPLGDEP